MPTRQVEVHTDALGFGSVRVDGQDVSSSIGATEIVTAKGEPTRVVLHMSPGAGVLWHGEAVVQQTVPGDMLDQLARLVEGLEPGAIEQAALMRADEFDGEHALTRAVLHEAARVVRGARP